MKNKNYSTYNEINKDYDVEAVTVDQLKQIVKTNPDTKIFIGTKKTKIDGNLTFQQEVRLFMQEQREFNQKIMSRIDNLVKKNNLEE